jgi:hypothetical protein
MRDILQNFYWKETLDCTNQHKTMAALEQTIHQRGGMGSVLATFEDIVVSETKSFLLLLGTYMRFVG